MSIDSYEFATRGVQFGDDEDVVANHMAGATAQSDRLYRPSAVPGRDEFERNYEFVYEPTYNVPFTAKTIRLITELYRVRFSSNGKAVSLERWLFIRGDSGRTGRTIWYLRTQKGVAVE